jgi:hypothetical protein
MVQTKSTEAGLVFPSPIPSAFQMQDADEREKPARGFEIGFDLAGQPFDQEFSAFIVNRTPPHIQGLDLRRRRGADGLVVAIAYQEVILDDAAERRQRQKDAPDSRFSFTLSANR